MKTYVKPAMTRRRLVSSSRVANTCWGYHSGGSDHSSPWWYDKNGPQSGFVSFVIEPGEACGDIADLLSVTWYQNRDALSSGRGIHVTAGQTVVTDNGHTVAPFDDTVAYLLSLGGSNGQPFKGENSLIQDNTGMS